MQLCLALAAVSYLILLPLDYAWYQLLGNCNGKESPACAVPGQALHVSSQSPGRVSPPGKANYAFSLLLLL